MYVVLNLSELKFNIIYEYYLIIMLKNILYLAGFDPATIHSPILNHPHELRDLSFVIANC